MADHPILFSAPMIRGLLREVEHPGTGKTNTRRIIKPQPPSFTPNVIDIGIPHQDDSGEWGQIETIWSAPSFDSPRGEPLREEWRPLRLPAKPGDRLWVREAHYLTDDGDYQYAVFAADPDDVREHLAHVEEMKAQPALAAVWRNHAKLRPSTHMPRWASRLTLIVESVKVERLNEISEEDARAEGFPITHDGRCYDPPPSSVDSWQGYGRASFCLYWSQLHGPGSWDANPWVAAIRFRVVKANIDTLEAIRPVRECEGVAG